MHGANANAIVMRRPDGSPMTRQEVIVRRRGALKWLPVLCSNDLVHGSWWFMWGSFLMGLFSIYPLIQKYIGLYRQQDDVMPATDYDITWAMLIVCGAFFTLGSIAFIHAFEEPPKRAFFYWFKHAQTDELLGAWLFLFGTMPGIPYMLVFFSLDPNAFYFFALLAAIVFVLASFLFVMACYPNDKKHENYALPVCTSMFGAQMWVVKHLANDWLAGTWFFFWANLLVTFASTVLLLIALGLGNPAQIFIWLSGTISSLFFLVGSAYFVSGSYPHASQFYYTTDRGQSDVTAPPSEVYADEIGLVPSTMQRRESNAASMLANTFTHLGSTVTTTVATTVTSTVINPFHSASAEAERAKKVAGRRRSVYGGSVRGHSSPAPTGSAVTLNPLQQALRNQMNAANAGVVIVNSMTKPTVPQQMEDRADPGAESSEAPATTEGDTPSTAAPSQSSGYVKLVSESGPDLMNDDHLVGEEQQLQHSGSAFVGRGGINRSSSGDNYKFASVSTVEPPAVTAPEVAAEGENDEEEEEEEEEDGDDTPVEEK